ncbi:MAG TPA: hypothetical protein VF789_11610 [Thermoanaerobaculia bacterium]
MAETQRLSPASPRAARPRSAHAGPHRLSMDDTHDLRPHRTVGPPPANPEPDAEPRQAAPPLTPTEKTIRGVLLGGLALTAAVLATRGAVLTQADILLGSTVLVAGAALLVVIEICRR